MKSKRSRDKDGERATKKKKSRVRITDDDANDDDMWVEKNIDIDGERVCPPLSSSGTCSHRTLSC